MSTDFPEYTGLVSVYFPVMKILGVFVIIIGPITLYLIQCHSDKIDKQYKRALLVHQSLTWLTYLIVNIGYIPMVMPPYQVVYAEGYLKDICPIIVITCLAFSVFTVGITSRALLFHLRALAVMPPNHWLGQSYVFYPMVVYYFAPSILISAIMLPIACYDQEKIKQNRFEIFKVFHDRYFNPQVLAFPFPSTAMDIWIAGTGIAIGSFIIVSVAFAIMTLRALNNLKTNMSQKTRAIHRKLTISLIIQTAVYNLIFVIVSLTGLTLGFIIGLGNDGPATFVIIVLMYSSSFLLGSVLLVATNDSYWRACRNVFRKGPSQPSSIVIIPKVRQSLSTHRLGSNRK